MLATAILAVAIGAVVSRALAFPLDFRFVRLVKAQGARGRQEDSDDQAMPPVLVIVPCKGLDPGLEDNLRSVLQQAYPRYSVVFVTSTEADPAFPLVRRLAQEPSGRSPGLDWVRAVAAQPSGIRAQKIDNQLRALGERGADTAVYVFLDSDARPHPRLLRALVAPLSRPDVGVSTGYRWLIANGGFWSAVASVWNNGGIALAADPSFGFAWGGAMAIRRQTFEQLGIRDYWQRGITDDGSLTIAVRRARRTIAFVPEALVASSSTHTFSQMAEWTTRQVKLLRCHLPQLWNLAFAAHGLSSLGLLLGLCGSILGLSPGTAWLVLALLLIDLVEWALLTTVVRPSLDPATGYRLRLWHGVLLPVAALVFLVNAIASLLSRRLTWRGISYELTSVPWAIVSAPADGDEQGPAAPERLS
jgi:ceramide glucosyltransferase